VNIPDLNHLRTNPRGWVKSPLGIIHPPTDEMSMVVGPVNGFEITNKAVYITENGIRRKASRREALEIRRRYREAVGAEIAAAAGVEPE
jgi:hypothetical protein